MSWDDKKIQILKDNWGNLTASVIAEKIGGMSRNAVIGKAHRLNLSAKIVAKGNLSNTPNKIKSINNGQNNSSKKIRKSRFKSLIIEKNFEPENPKQLEELENHCRWPIGHPNEDSFYFCGRTPLKDNKNKYTYCKLHLLYAFQLPKGKNEDTAEKENEVPQYNNIGKKIKSA